MPRMRRRRALRPRLPLGGAGRPQSTECHGCNGRGHYKAQCPTANPHLKKGAGKGQWGGKKGDKGKGKGGKSWGGKGKGNKGKGKGMYGLDLMGSWGGDGWGGEENWQGEDWNAQGYLRSLATVSAVEKPDRDIASPPTTAPTAGAPYPGKGPTPLSDRYGAISEPEDSNYAVPITELVVERRRKPRNKTKNKTSFKPPSGCECKSAHGKCGLVATEAPADPALPDMQSLPPRRSYRRRGRSIERSWRRTTRS